MTKCPNCLIRTVYGSHRQQLAVLRTAGRDRGENLSRRLRPDSNKLTHRNSAEGARLDLSLASFSLSY